MIDYLREDTVTRIDLEIVCGMVLSVETVYHAVKERM